MLKTGLESKTGTAAAAAGLMMPLAAQDYLGRGSQASASPLSALMPMNAPDVRGAGGRFRQALGAAQLNPMTAADHIPGVRKGRAGQSEHEALTEQAQKWVGQTFFGTLLKQMHDSPFKSEMFSGGRGGQAFAPMMDQHLIDRMSRASGKKLVKGIVRQIEGRAAYRRQQAAGKAGENAAGAYDGVNGAKQPTDGQGQQQPQQQQQQDASPNAHRSGRSRVAAGLRA